MKYDSIWFWTKYPRMQTVPVTSRGKHPNLKHASIHPLPFAGTDNKLIIYIIIISNIGTVKSLSKAYFYSVILC